MSFSDMVEFLDRSWKARAFIVPSLLGQPGIGKTAAVMQHAANVGAGKVVTIIASQILPNEVSGITMPVPERHAMEIYDHYRLSSLEDGDILFFDEMLEADQMVLSACLTLIESRQLMSGKKMPDIQIVAATNETIKPTQLKLNIRQRFVWREFTSDNNEVVAFIKEKTGLDVKPVVHLLSYSGTGFNVLTPRSLTKMAQWICVADDKKEARAIADQINAIWGSTLGLSLFKAWSDKYGKENDVKSALEEAAKEAGCWDVYHENVPLLTIEELIEVLQADSHWERMADILSKMDVQDEEIKF